LKKKQTRWIDVDDDENEEEDASQVPYSKEKAERINRERIAKEEGWKDVDENDIPYFNSSERITRPAKQALKTDNEYFTGERNKKLLVHIIQNGVEVTRPLRKRIYDQQVFWRKRTYPIDIKKTIVDSKGIHHLYVSANDMAILSFNKDHEDNCRKCGGKMFIDARNARDLVKRNTIQAIWGIDSTHMILLMVFAIGAMAAVGFAFYSYNQDTLHNTQLKAEQARNTELINENGILRNMTLNQQNNNNPIPPSGNIPDIPDIPDTTEPPDVNRIRPEQEQEQPDLEEETPI
jgi:hypothetical protein